MNTTSYISLLTNHLAFASKEDCTDEQRTRIIKHVEQFSAYAQAGLIKYNDNTTTVPCNDARFELIWSVRAD